MPADGAFGADLLGPSLLVGLGLAATFIALTVTAVEGVFEQQYGLASGLINTTQQIGGALGLAILAAVANGRTSGLLDDGSEPIAALTQGFQSALLVAAGFARRRDRPGRRAGRRDGPQPPRGKHAEPVPSPADRPAAQTAEA